MIDDRERVAVAPVTELELALEVGAPQVVRGNPSGQRRAARTMARPAAPLDQAMAVQHGMDGTFGRNPDVARQPADQQLADLARAPVRLVAFEPDDEGLELRGQLVGVADRPARAVAQGRKPVLFVAVENLVAGLAGDAELPAHVRHGFPVQQAGDKAQAFLHHRTRFPRHQHLPPKGEKCYPCVRYEVSPMSRVAHLARMDRGESERGIPLRFLRAPESAVFERGSGWRTIGRITRAKQPTKRPASISPKPTQASTVSSSACKRPGRSTAWAGWYCRSVITPTSSRSTASAWRCAPTASARRRSSPT